MSKKLTSSNEVTPAPLGMRKSSIKARMSDIQVGTTVSPCWGTKACGAPMAFARVVGVLLIKVTRGLSDPVPIGGTFGLGLAGTGWTMYSGRVHFVGFVAEVHLPSGPTVLTCVLCDSSCLSSALVLSAQGRKDCGGGQISPAEACPLAGGRASGLESAACWFFSQWTALCALKLLKPQKSPPSGGAQKGGWMAPLP
eukprot:4169565-Amphidinium_carterae.1